MLLGNISGILLETHIKLSKHSMPNYLVLYVLIANLFHSCLVPGPLISGEQKSFSQSYQNSCYFSIGFY